MSLRILGGERRGTVLLTPRGAATRPTLGRVRASLFTMLHDRLPDARVLDGFAGCGALGLEALSRGAARATLIEKARAGLDALRANIDKLGWGDRATVAAGDMFRILGATEPVAGAPFDLLFFDPPYGLGLCERTLRKLAPRLEAWMTEDGLIVMQAGVDDRFDDSYGDLVRQDSRTHGKTRIDFYSKK